jgi:hypothetical protein
MDSITREGFEAALRSWSSGMSDEAMEEYWKSYSDATRRRGIP